MEIDKKTFQLTINGEKHRIEAVPEKPLLYVLRNQLALNGPKYGCGSGQCGACMVMINDQAVMSCLIPTEAAEGKDICTLAGLVQKDGKLHAVQQAFMDEQAAQCGYCTNGMIISAVSLLNKKADPDDQEIRQALQINLCRCGTHSRVIRAVRRAAEGGAG